MIRELKSGWLRIKSGRFHELVYLMMKYSLRRLPVVKHYLASKKASIKLDKLLLRYKGRKAKFDTISVVYILDETDTELLTRSIFTLKKHVINPHVIFIDLSNNEEVITKMIKNYLPKSQRIVVGENDRLTEIFQTVGNTPDLRESVLFVNEHVKFNDLCSMVDSITLDPETIYCADFIYSKNETNNLYINRTWVSYYENLNHFKSYFPLFSAKTIRSVDLQRIFRNDFKRLPGFLSVKKMDQDFSLNVFKSYFERTFDVSVICQKDGKRNYKLPFDQKVSIIILTRDKVDYLSKCLESITKSTYKNYEVIIVDHLSNEETQSYLKNLPHKIIRYEGEFNFSHMNNLAADQATGDMFCFLNNDTEVITPEWIEILGGFAVQSDIGAVGAKLLFQNGLIQHAGIKINKDYSSSSHVLTYEKDNQLAVELSRITWPDAVTGACVFVEKKKFNEVGGFEEAYKIIWQDSDLCLKLEKAGYKTLCIPYVKLFHHESSTRKLYPTEKEVHDQALFQRTWRH